MFLLSSVGFYSGFSATLVSKPVFFGLCFLLLIMNRNTFLAPTPWYWVCSRLFLALILGWTLMVLVFVIVLLVWLIGRMVWLKGRMVWLIVRMVWLGLVLVLVIVLLIWVTVVMVLVISSEGLGHIQWWSGSHLVMVWVIVVMVCFLLSGSYLLMVCVSLGHRCWWSMLVWAIVVVIKFLLFSLYCCMLQFFPSVWCPGCKELSAVMHHIIQHTKHWVLAPNYSRLDSACVIFTPTF